jgi:hypothetical protein
MFNTFGLLFMYVSSLAGRLLQGWYRLRCDSCCNSVTAATAPTLQLAVYLFFCCWLRFERLAV